MLIVGMDVGEQETVGAWLIEGFDVGIREVGVNETEGLTEGTELGRDDGNVVYPTPRVGISVG